MLVVKVIRVGDEIPTVNVVDKSVAVVVKAVLRAIAAQFIESRLARVGPKIRTKVGMRDISARVDNGDDHLSTSFR
jgi:hypothetical protein